MKKLNVLYNTDNNYVDIVMASMISLMENSLFDEVDFHIITANFDSSCYQKIERLYECYPNLNIFYYDLENFPIDEYNINSWRGTQISNSVLFFQSIIGSKINSMNNLLYLDGDTIIVNPLVNIKEYDDGIYLARDAGLMRYNKNILGITKDYYNSGVIYINIPYWIENNCEGKIKNFLLNNNASKLIHPDQDVINVSLNKELNSLPLSYNYPMYFDLFNEREKKLFFNKNRNISYEEVTKQEIVPNILHAYGAFGITPWSNNSVNPYNDIFMKYIYKANSDYSLKELDFIRRIISCNESVFKTALIIKGYTPERVNNKVKELLKK